MQQGDVFFLLLSLILSHKNLVIALWLSWPSVVFALFWFFSNLGKKTYAAPNNKYIFSQFLPFASRSRSATEYSQISFVSDDLLNHVQQSQKLCTGQGDVPNMLLTTKDWADRASHSGKKPHEKWPESLCSSAPWSNKQPEKHNEPRSNSTSLSHGKNYAQNRERVVRHRNRQTWNMFFLNLSGLLSLFFITFPNPFFITCSTEAEPTLVLLSSASSCID